MKRFIQKVRESNPPVSIRYGTAMTWTLFVYVYGMAMGILIAKI